ncbi:SNF2-related protein [Flavobacterium sp. MMLR14_040]|uniref:SNF2-related protein n=1 Tax=Flavobacterium sp. MMLR14_040 TaxID=3093843 RepID=UPI00298F6DC2|nr:SNF2-related protein [Flavobacterium sp. MMLR14_040]MDW8850116.1 SNF2-related protein [Flavobacterium sp. MMLR14_040]
MNLTSYHAKYFAYELTRQRPSNDLGKLTSSLQDAQVDLNPHQVEAALFAFQSPLSNGAILADEVGLGKTIEAGIILSQQWAERKRRLLIIAPSNLRKQWNQELADKFFLPSFILETKSFKDQLKLGNLNPFNQNDSIVICSYHFAKNKAIYVEQTQWDLVIIDEAHRLRNVYKASNKIGNVIKDSIQNRKKVLLTATPLQNSILELYGLVSIIDDFVFGDLKSFKSQYNRQLDEGNYDDLKSRLLPVCHRTLRRQVLEYINYTERRAFCEKFSPSDEEHQLYEWVSAYLQRPKLYALPNSQRQLMTLILRKLLASSSYAIYGTLDALVEKLQKILLKHRNNDLILKLELDFETLDEISDEWVDDEGEDVVAEIEFTDEDIEAINIEIGDLKKFRDLAQRIKTNSKAERLVVALQKAFEEIEKLGANKKALIFTESRRTQEFIYKLLEERGYQNKIVQFNGANSDFKSREIYKNWLEEHKGTDKITGSPTADKRAALVDYFKEEATIMIATEAAAEGINLQFCSLIVNFDMPWNPQRIEQRIGRCHRYGQKHDVVVVNFLNTKNAADQRVYQLLDQKFQLFNGVFGSSDEVLGSIGNGVDFEKRIAQIYNDCRTVEEIKNAFDSLQEELRPEISEKIQAVRTTLLEHFDEAVKEKLKANLLETKLHLSIFEEKLWKTTKYFLDGYAEFSDDYSFKLIESPFKNENIHSGPYMILKPKEGQRKSEILIPDDTNVYRIGHKLAQRILLACKSSFTPVKEVIFNYTNTPVKITLLENYIGKSGWFQVQHLTINSFEEEDYILMACYSDEGEIIDSETAQRFFSLYAVENREVEFIDEDSSMFRDLIDNERQKIVSENANRNRDFFDIEMDKLDQWADDMKISLEKEIRDLDAEIKLRKSESKKMLNLEAKVKSQRQIKELEKKRSEKRQTLFSAQDDIDDKKETLLSDIEKRLNQKIKQEELFTIKWKMI